MPSHSPENDAQKNSDHPNKWMVAVLSRDNGILQSMTSVLLLTLLLLQVKLTLLFRFLLVSFDAQEHE